MFLVSLAFLVTESFHPFCILDFRGSYAEKKNKKGKNNKGFPSESILAVGFGICILGLAAINLFWSDHEMSEQENRMLASKPKLSVSSVLSGDYMEKYESYLADQFAGRDFLRNIKVTLGRFGGNKMRMACCLESRDSFWKR